MVRFEGLRMEIPHPDSPLARWRLNLREYLSYTVLVTCPDLMGYSVNQGWTDMRCIETLSNLQESHWLREGTIPANVFAVAIAHFTARALDEGQKASQSMEEGECHLSQTHENVELWGLRLRLLGEELIRSKKILLLTDSGAIIYRRGKDKHVKPESFLNHPDCTHPWTNIITSCESGAGWANWAASLSVFIGKCGSIMEVCPDGKKRFPSHVTMVVIDNLNGTGANYESEEANLSDEKKTPMTKFMSDVVAQAAIEEMLDFIGYFKSAIYCQMAPAKHWGMPAAVDDIANNIRQRARAKKIATLDATHFWRSIKDFMGSESLDTKVVKPGENAGEAQVGNNAVHWHHYEAGDTKALPFHWDRFLFRIVCYLETSLIHESVNSKVFNMDEIKRLSDNIKSETLACKLSMEDFGQKPGEIAQDVIPTSKSYREAVSPPPKRRALAAPIIAPRGENAGNSQYSGSGAPQGDNAGNSQSSGSGAPRGNAPSLVVETTENGSELKGESASAEEVAERVEKIMYFVSNVYGMDDSRVFAKESKPHILPPWATTPDMGKCIMCDLLHEVVQQGKTEDCLKCPKTCCMRSSDRERQRTA